MSRVSGDASSAEETNTPITVTCDTTFKEQLKRLQTPCDFTLNTNLHHPRPPGLHWTPVFGAALNRCGCSLCNVRFLHRFVILLNFLDKPLNCPRETCWSWKPHTSHQLGWNYTAPVSACVKERWERTQWKGHRGQRRSHFLSHVVLRYFKKHIYLRERAKKKLSAPILVLVNTWNC